MNGDIQVDQALFGYSEGHSLIASSTTFSPTTLQLLSALTDMSGPVMVPGFEESYTGLYLPETDYYALCKTWFAPEMRRPGCVWSHVLLIHLADIASLEDPGTLRQVFVRPWSGFDAVEYRKSVRIACKGVHVQLSSNCRATALNLLQALYENPTQAILQLAPDSRVLEDLVFAVWGQQWPRLRRNFSFSTGALSDRSRLGPFFDLQVVAETNQRLLPSDGPNNVTLRFRNELSTSHPGWLAGPLEDLFLPSKSLRNFLNGSGADVLQPRKSFRALVEIFGCLWDEVSVADLLEVTVKFFPEPHMAEQLKLRLFGPSVSREDAADYYSEGDVLAVIGSTEYYESFNRDALGLFTRGKKLCAEHPTSARTLLAELFRSSANPLGEEILAGVISAIGPEIARELTNEQPQFLPALFRAKPNLAGSSELWSAAGDHKRELFDSLATHQTLDEDVVRGIVRALLESGSEVFIRRALDRWGQTAVFALLDWTATHDHLGSACRDALTFHVKSVADWTEADGKRSIKSLVASAHVIAPYSYQVSTRDTTLWQRTLIDLQKIHDQNEIRYFCAFLVALALQNAPPAPLALISDCFENLHESARQNRLTDDAWIVVDPIVPHLSWHNDWDKCERLRRGLIVAFIQHQWPAFELTQRISDATLRKQLLKSAGKVEGGKDFLRGIRQVIRKSSEMSDSF